MNDTYSHQVALAGTTTSYSAQNHFTFADIRIWYFTQMLPPFTEWRRNIWHICPFSTQRERRSDRVCYRFARATETREYLEQFAMDAVMSCQIARLSAAGPRVASHRPQGNSKPDQVSAFSVERKSKYSNKSTWQAKAWGRQQSPNPTTTPGPGPNTAPVPLPTGAEVRISFQSPRPS